MCEYDFVTPTEGTFGFGPLENVRGQIKRALALDCKISVLVQEDGSHLPLSVAGQKIAQSILGSAFKALKYVPQPGEVNSGDNQGIMESIECTPEMHVLDSAETQYGNDGVPAYEFGFPLLYTLEV